MSQNPDAANVGRTQSSLRYMSGFGNEFETEALDGALPIGQNSPQKCAYGLVSELVSGTSFTAARALNRRSYVFRIRPSALDARFTRKDNGHFLTPPFEGPADPNYHAWGPLGRPSKSQDLLESLATLAGNGSPLSQSGMAIHAYAATASMKERVFANCDGEMLFVLRTGRLRFVTEFGVIEAAPRELVVIPKGIKFRVELIDDYGCGFVCENYGTPFRLPELGLIGTNGLANVADFQIPVASYEDSDAPIEMVTKYGGNLWATEMPHSPLDVVAWRGSLYPYKYDANRFVQLGTLTVDHPDPSIFTVLTSPSDAILGPNADIMVVRSPSWQVAEHTFRPPGYHRNAVGEFVMWLEGVFSSLEPGSFTACNNWTPHGPEVSELAIGRAAPQDPFRVDHAYVVVVESRFPMLFTEFARNAKELMVNYTRHWGGFSKEFTGG